MQLPVFDVDPIESVIQSPDAWVKKLSIEVAQLLASCYTAEELFNAPRTIKGTVRSNRSHPHHPIAKWVQTSHSNFMWALEWGYFAILEGLEHRQIIKTAHHTTFFDWVLTNLPHLPQIERTDFVKPKAYADLPVCVAYQTYFVAEKQHLAKWTNRPVPNWYSGNVV